MKGCEWGGRQSRTAPYWPSSTGTPQTGANGIRWRPTSPSATCTWQPPPRGTPAGRAMISSPPSTTTGFSPTTRGGRSSGRQSAGTTGAASAPACWRSGTPFDRGERTSGYAISTLGRRPPHLPHTCEFCGECNTVSSAASRGGQQVRAVRPGGRVPLARTSRGPAQAHGGGGLAPAHQEGTRPLTGTRGPRGLCPSVDPRAPAGPHIRCAPVARVRALTPSRRHPLQSPQYHATPTGGWAGTSQGPPPSAGGHRPGPGTRRGG